MALGHPVAVAHHGRGLAEIIGTTAIAVACMNDATRCKIIGVKHIVHTLF